MAFQEYIIEIDYDRQCLTFYKPCYFWEHKSLDGFTTLRMDVKNTIPLIEVSILTNDATFLPLILMLDTGAGNALSLNPSSMPGYSIPVSSRDGNMNGKVGWIREVLFGPFQPHDVLADCDDNQPVANNKEGVGHNGSLGEEFLRRFNMILDYPDKMIHIMRNSDFEDGFHHDMSGLEILAPDPCEHRYLITGVRKQSKAELAGIRPGDEILSINGTPAIQLHLDEIYHDLLDNEGRKIRAHFRPEKYF
jgi:hypothetical protein